MRATINMAVEEFCRGVKTNRIFPALEQAFFGATGRSVGPAERDSWLNSLPRLSGAIELAGLPDDTCIGLEVVIPYYSERIDAVLYGHDAAGRAFAVLIELKQWSHVDLAEDGRVVVAMRSGLTMKAHPSYQVDRYRRHLVRSPATFDFDVLDSPHEVLAWVRGRNASEPNSARLTAGWCWPWSDPRPDGSLVDDIVIGDFAFPWELKNGKRGKPGIPEAKHWAVDPRGADQAGTVYSVQGFEFRYVGLLMGPDLVIRDGEWVAVPKANYRKVLCAKPPEAVSIYLRRIYRTLFTRPLRGLRVFSVDAETREFLRSQIDRTPLGTEEKRWVDGVLARKKGLGF